jgi:class 3 adenylate cyclase/tetratricopeptide (TPR) repeat protein
VDIAAWLSGLGLARYEASFRENAIDVDVLVKLTAEDLKELGVAAVGDRRRLLEALEKLREQPVPSATQHAGERREVAVLFADLTGFTALSREVDAEELHSVLSHYFDRVDRIVEQFGGHIDKHVGDCVMAVFGAPMAHGNDAERAVRAALAIRDAIPELSRALSRPVSIHVGIAGGQVVASGSGSANYREYTVTGETVNLASRLTDAAGPGEILLSEAVRRPLAERLHCTEHAALVIKGFTTPVQAWCLVGLRRTSERRFVGRHSELRQFRALLESCREIGRGHTVYVRGEAGLGKTRLVEEYQRAADEAGFACHSGTVLEFGTRTGRDPIRSLLRSLLTLYSAGDEKTARNAAAHAMADGLANDGDAVFLNDLLDLPQPPALRALYDAMDNETRIRGRRDVVTRIVERGSGLQPRLLAVEDLHWSDRTTQEDLAAVAATVAGCPAILVMTSRLEADPLGQEWRAATGGAPLSVFDLAPLRVDEARLLAESFVDSGRDFAERCIERAAGNPLFLEQLLRHAGLTAEDRVPGSVQNLVQARLDRLDPEDKAILQAASVLGQRFEREALNSLVDSSAVALRRLISHLLLRAWGDGFAFHHALIRDAVYDSLLKSRRRELHRRAAEWYASRDPLLCAEHLDRAADPDAASAYRNAAQREMAAYHYESALRLVSRGLDLASDHTDRFSLECLRGDLLHDLGDMTSARGAYESALTVAETDAERCQAWIGLASVKRVTDDLDGALTDLDRAAAAAGKEGLLLEASRIHFLRGNLFFPRGDIEGCVREHNRSLVLAREASASEQEAAALGGLGDGEYLRGHMMSAHDAFSRCIDLCQRHGFGRIEVANLPMRAFTRWFAGETRAALDAALASIAAAEKVGHRRALALAHISACYCLDSLSEWDRAWEHATAALLLAQELGATRFEGEALALHATLHRAAGRRPEALADIRRALAISRQIGMAYLGAFCFGILAHTTDDADVFKEALAEGATLLDAGAVSLNHYLFRRGAIDACLDRSNWAGAEVHAAALETYARREPSPFSDFVVGRARGIIACANGQLDGKYMTELRRLRDDGERFGFLWALPTIDALLRIA